ncbi:torsin-1A-interacting protein 2-like isoform X8 [Stegostoma tigrinum]|uniref:torsin-1A-interacting protein 2-like isoform X8 n=1 Tax=Stegostoma tigrinum TaxID=3053191 RepID=UPI002870A6BF|nr:torsin-1A-interacting protein 2-like isoform X8 [Stegostoma tigrinum]
MSVRFTRSTRGRFKDSRESSREKSYAGIKVTSRSPIKNQRKRSVDSDYGMKSESPEPPKKSPKATDSQHASSSELPESQRKSPKGRFSARRQPQENQDDHSVPVKGDLELQPNTKPVVMDYSSETNQVSPDGNQSEDTDGLSVSPQNPADEDMDSESEVEVERLQESTRVSTLQTFSGPFPSTGNMQRVPDRQTPVYSHQAQADRHQTTSQIKYQTYSDVQYGAPSPRWRPAADLPATSHRENQNYSDVRCGAKSTRLTPVADTYQPTNYRKPQYYKDSAQAARFIRPTAKESKSSSWKVIFPALGLVVVLSVCVFYLWVFEKPDHRKLKEELFLAKWQEMKTKFPNQQDELWKRSSILLKKHMGEAVPTQPIILMFTAARDAKKTMQCLTHRIAEVYSSVFNSSALEIDGSAQNLKDSNTVKLELDNQLTAEFTGGRKAAVIHHFQDLPPSSTFLFYKYCDHENAAFKDVSLLITVLLDEPMLKPDLPLKDLEEMVHDFVKKKFCSDKQHMDNDKLSGLWSRISHLVLPISPEREIETGDCPP